MVDNTVIFAYSVHPPAASQKESTWYSTADPHNYIKEYTAETNMVVRTKLYVPHVLIHYGYPRIVT